MKKISLILAFLACFAGPAAADWNQLGVSGRGTTDYYVDIHTKHQTTDGTVAIAYLYDMHKMRECETGEPKMYLSRSGDHEFDCNARTYRVASCTRFADHMASGQVVSTDAAPGEWSQIPPRSSIMKMYKVACSASR